MAQATLRYQADLNQLLDDFEPLVVRVASSADANDIDTWWRGALPTLMALTAAFFPASYDVSVRYLSDLAEENDEDLAFPPLVTPPAGKLATSLTVTGPVAFKRSIGEGRTVAEAVRNLQTGLVGSSSRHVRNVGRATVIDAAVRNQTVVGWRRVTAANPCFFCALLASRGAVYESRNTALFTNGDPYHDHCRCTAEPLFGEEEDPASVQELYEFYLKATAGTSGREARKAFRRAWNSRGDVFRGPLGI